ncbi:MAG TPA: hypothetical protein VFR81_06500 [Longimicrobium sp.]|nr:hypothetical protein [Longimicrobium sp.]
MTDESRAAGRTPDPLAPGGMDPEGTIVSLLRSIESSQAKLVEAAAKGGRPHWTARAVAVAGILTPVVIAVGGWAVTSRIERIKVEDQRIAREQAAENRELQVIQPFMPFLLGDDEEKKEIAIQAIFELGNVKLAKFASGIRPTVGSGRALRAIAASPKLSPTQRKDLEQAYLALPDSVREQLVPVSSSTP